MEKSKASPFVLVDGSSYLHRAYHALPPLTNSTGQPTGAIYGVVNMLRRLMQKYHPKYMAVIFDAKGKNFRHELYPAYKANRPPMPEDLRLQIEPLHEIIKALGLPLLVIEGVEADDVIGTLAKQATDAGLDTLISTSDKDFTQLVDDHVTLVDTMTNTVMDIPAVQKKFGVPPALIIDYLTLVGDSSDNVPGVPKVGAKTASKLLNDYGSLRALLEHADEIKGKMGEHLRASLSQISISRELVTIKTDVDLPYQPKELINEENDRERLIRLCAQLEMKAWLKELQSNRKEKPSVQTDFIQEDSNRLSGSSQITVAPKGRYHTILSDKDLIHLLGRLKEMKKIVIDTETTSLDYMEAKLVGLSFSVTPEEAFYIPLGHDYPGCPKQLDLQMVLEKLKPILENPAIWKIGHHIKYDKEVLANYGIDLKGITYDTMLESYVLNSTATRHNMDALALKYLQFEKISYEEVAGKGVKQVSFSAVPIEQASDYSAEDADITFRLHHYFWPKLEADEKLKFVFSEIEMSLLSVLAKMERYGVLVDADALKEQSEALTKRLQTIEKQIFTLSGVAFNLDSPKQLQEVLYERLGLPILKKTPTGQPSTAEPILEELAFTFPLPALILDYRSLSKLKSTYTDRLPTQINLRTGRVHTSYHQAVTATGRLSSSDPNLQNIPIRTSEGRRIRQAFVAPPGYKLLSADYSQIELRLVAHLSEDRGLIEDFRAGLDIHQATASKLFDVSLSEVTDVQRRKAKTINFGLMYGMSPFGLSKRLGIPRSDAKAYIDAYFAKYPAIRDYMDRTRDFAKEKGYVETLFGRRLYTPEIQSRNRQLRDAAERAAINGPLQGTAADIIKLAMLKIDEWISTSSLDIHLIMQVHDELIFEVKEADVRVAVDKIKELMGKAAALCVPLTVDIGIGDNWDEAH